MMISLPRAAFLLAGVLALSTAANAQDPVGIWKTKMDFQGDVREATITITKGASGALAGTWSGQQGDAELSNVKFADGTLSFVRNVSFNANNFELAFEGTIEGNDLNGAFITDFGEMAITGMREGAAAPEGVAALVGTWNGTSTVLGGEMGFQLVIGDDLSAMIQTDHASMPVRDLKMDGNQLSYIVAVEAGSQKYELHFTGTVESGTFSGRFSLPPMGEIAEVSAAKAAAKDLSALVGSWELKSQSEMGEQTSSLVINDDMSGTINFGEFGSYPLDYVDIIKGDEGDELWFGIAASFDDQQIYIEFAGKFEGDKFSGGLWAMDQEMAKITGTKKK